MQKIEQILKGFDPTKDKYISREFQSFGIYLAEQLNDYKHRSLYIKLAKTVHRSILEKALSFVSDSNARNKVALFMWKLAQLRKGQLPPRGAQAKPRTLMWKLAQLKAGNTTNTTNTTNFKYKKKK